MSDSDKEPSIPQIVLETLVEAASLLPQLLPRPFETKYSWATRLKHVDPNSYQRSVYRLKERGLIAFVNKNNQKFIQLTKAGQLEALFQKSRLDKPKQWDGKWRLFIFDIPEDSKDKRTLIRKMLKNSGYYKLQASVYICPYPLNREGIEYLNRSDLSDFIRIMKIEEMDDEKKLLKHFGLRR